MEERVLPALRRTVLLVAFRVTSTGGHLNACGTHRRARPRHIWPGTSAYLQRMCRACPGCRLADIAKIRCADLVYSFPAEAPGCHLWICLLPEQKFSCAGTEHYVVAARGTTSFAMAEDAAEQILVRWHPRPRRRCGGALAFPTLLSWTKTASVWVPLCMDTWCVAMTHVIPDRNKCPSQPNETYHPGCHEEGVTAL